VSGRTADLKAHLERRIREAIVAEGWGGEGPAEAGIVLELPKEAAHGDIACPAAFAMAKAARKPPREVAERLAARLGPDDVVGSVAVAGGGYLNFLLGDSVWRDIVAEVAERGERYGTSNVLAGERILVEFVSANPTGPLGVVNARQAAFGDALCRCLAAAGAKVEKEYYANDAGAQVRNLGLSVIARLKESRGEPFEIPKDGYQGEYVKDLAREIEVLDSGLSGRPVEQVAAAAVEVMIGRQKADLDRMGVGFDRWFRERDLHSDGRVDQALDLLRAKGVIFDKDGAVWFAATRFGDEKDRVLRKTDGAPTYTLPDIAYHQDKYGRGYTRIVDIVGADHQTEMATLRSALKVLGMDTDRLEVIITQFVTLKRGSEKVVMSKRSGNVIPLSELVDEVGVDAARFFFLLRAPSSHLDFDLELAKSTTMDNPVYYLQYAHARLCSLIERAKAEGLPAPSPDAADPALLVEPETRLVLRRLVRYPFMVEKAATGRAPHLLTHELMELAQAIHQFYTHNRVVGAPTAEIGLARLALVSAGRRVLANGLGLLGVSAPERM